MQYVLVVHIVAILSMRLMALLLTPYLAVHNEHERHSFILGWFSYVWHKPFQCACGLGRFASNSLDMSPESEGEVQNDSKIFYYPFGIDCMSFNQ